MSYEVEITRAEPVWTAVVKGRVSANELSQFVPAACGEAWSFIRSAHLPRPGRNVALYGDAGGGGRGGGVGTVWRQPAGSLLAVACGSRGARRSLRAV